MSITAGDAKSLNPRKELHFQKQSRNNAKNYFCVSSYTFYIGDEKRKYGGLCRSLDYGIGYRLMPQGIACKGVTVSKFFDVV